MNKALYKQYDSRWGSKPYPTKASSFSGNGCGCVACTHLIIEQDKYKDLTPEPVRKWMVNQGFAAAHQGTSWSGIKKTLEHYGYTVTHIDVNDPMSKAWKELNKKNRIGIILFLGGSAPNGMVWTAGGHYVAFTDYYVGDDERHYFYTKDSGGRDNDSAKHGYYSYERSMKGLVYQMWIVEKKGVKSSTAAEPSTSSSVQQQPAAETSTKGVYTGNYPSISPYLKKGSKGTEVKRLQKFLNWYGNYSLDVDGDFGPKTEKAVIKFQEKEIGKGQGDGIVGPKTLAAMKKVGGAGELKPVETTPISTKVKLKGMDISTWQGKCSVEDFKKAKADGINYVILRVGFTGSDSMEPTLDNCFKNNYTNAKKAGLKIGYYYYSLAKTEAMAKKEAEFTLKHIKDKQCDYPVYIDIEDSHQSSASSSALAKVCNKFCNIVNKAGYTAGVYANVSWFSNKIGNITAPHTKWVAQYYKECQYKGDYDMWQYTSSGNVAGMDGKIDLNWCYKKF